MTKVRIDSDRDGWFWHFPIPKGQEPRPLEDKDKSKVRGSTYDEIRNLAVAAGHEIDNAGWKQKLLMWNWHSVGFDRYPGWEIEHNSPPWCRIEHVNKADAWEGRKKVSEHPGTKSSSDVCNAWDDVAQAQFYTRDISYDGSCSVGNGEAYGSLWWFRTAAERDRFLAWLPTFDPTIKVVYRSAAELPPTERG